jgi:hypothetical protein
MKRVTVAHVSLQKGGIAPLTMDKRCYKTFGRRLHEEPDFGKRIKIHDYFMKHRTREEAKEVSGLK